MSRGLVSVIIPCFNCARFVGEAIRSALNQTYEPLEVIVVDDGSTDDSRQIIRSFGNRIRWEFQANHGACAARNRGLELSRGEFIQFLDADDLLHADKLRRQVCEVRHERVVAFGPWLMFSGASPSPPYRADRRCIVSEDNLVLQYLRGKFITSHSLLWPREILLSIGGWDRSIVANQDGDLLM
ncbi:MAG TPA: glycosyltransferase family A protein, partial [Tepidisphaeraceae bacterium]|nr:glycosyltransferase family A protein [Tepidisphaeraceae bacterium]